MKFYRVPTRNTFENEGCGDEHTGYTYHTSVKEAKKAWRNSKAKADDGDEIEVFEFKLNKKEVLQFLNNHCGYPNNG